MKRIFSNPLRSLVLAVSVAASPAAATQTDTMTFDVYLGGFRAGVMGVSGISDGRNYRAAAKLKTTGLIALIQEVGYDARSSGRITSGGYVPSSYQETANTGRRATSATMEYRRGVPQIKVYDPPQRPRDRDVDPATQGGTLDPMTTIYALLRDLPEADVCTLNIFMFDGRRRSQVISNGPEPNGSSIECRGEYRRIAGFKRSEMEDQTSFAFEMRYVLNGNGEFSVERIEFQTLYGKAIFRRR